MDVYVYGDESGTLAPAHNSHYVFGGLILLGRRQKDSAIRRFLSIEKQIAANCYTVQDHDKYGPLLCRDALTAK